MNNADKQYQNLLTNILENGRQKGDRTGTGTISIPFATLDFDMSEGFPLLTTKKMFTKAIVHELLWFLRGDTNIQYLEQNGVTIWTSDAYREYSKKWNPTGYPNDGMTLINPLTFERTKEVLSKDRFANRIKTDNDFASRWGELGPVYGAQWRKWGEKGNYYSEHNDYTKGIDQIQQVMDKLINNPDDRRIMVSAWNIADIPNMALPPCHYGFQLYTEDATREEQSKYWGKYQSINQFHTESWPTNMPTKNVSLIWDQRSCDTFLGIPFNIASYGILLHMFAKQANMIPGRLIGSLKNVHIYNNHVEQCKEQISREPRALPELRINWDVKDIFSYKFEDITVLDYNPHDKIVGDISV